MEVTKESYILSRDIVRVDIKKRTFLRFIKIHRFAIIVTTIFLSLIILEGILLNQFINLLLKL